MIQESLVTLLNPLLAGGIHPMIAPQNAARPYGIYQRIDKTVENTLAGNGSPPINNSRFQIDVFAETYAAVQAAALAIAGAMQTWAIQNVELAEREDYELDVRLYRISMDFSVWHY